MPVTDTVVLTAEVKDQGHKLQTLEAKVDDLHQDIRSIKTAILGDPTDSTRPSISIRLDRLEQRDAFRTKVMWAAGSAIIVLFIERLRDVL